MPDSFEDISIEIATQFLQTVVFVDDKAFPKFEDSKPKTIENIKEPGRKKANESNVKKMSKISVDNSRNIDGKALIRDFASRGLVCTILEPEENEDIVSETAKIGRRADLIVLDWVIYNDDGELARNIISTIIKNDQIGKRLRMICIYTTKDDLKSVSKSVQKRFTDDKLKFKINKLNKTDINLGATKIIFLSKDIDEKNSKSDTKFVSIENLPKRLIREFAEMTTGLVSNTTLCALSAIRSNTHEILSRLHKDIDAPFLSHRASLPNPEDASDLLISIILGEIRILLDRKVITDKTISLDVIEKAFIYKFGDQTRSLSLTIGENDTYELTFENLKKILDSGFDVWGKTQLNERAMSKEKLRKIKNCLSESFSNLFSKLGNISLENEFAMITSLGKWYQKSHIDDTFRLPSLDLGTIIKKKTRKIKGKPEKDEYYLCIMPSCDCIRISGNRDFPFIKLDIVEKSENNARFSIIVLDKKENYSSVIYLQPRTESYMQKIISFTADLNSKIMSLKQRDEIIFEDINKIKYSWVGETKYTKVQKIIHEYVSNLFRVGLDESEWLRESGKLKFNANN